jgi:hypothetical protein
MNDVTPVRHTYATNLPSVKVGGRGLIGLAMVAARSRVPDRRAAPSMPALSQGERWIEAWVDRWAGALTRSAVLFGACALTAGWLQGGIL